MTKTFGRKAASYSPFSFTPLGGKHQISSIMVAARNDRDDVVFNEVNQAIGMIDAA